MAAVRRPVPAEVEHGTGRRCRSLPTVTAQRQSAIDGLRRSMYPRDQGHAEATGLLAVWRCSPRSPPPRSTFRRPAVPGQPAGDSTLVEMTAWASLLHCAAECARIWQGIGQCAEHPILHPLTFARLAR